MVASRNDVREGVKQALSRVVSDKLGIKAVVDDYTFDRDHRMYHYSYHLKPNVLSALFRWVNR